MLSIIAYLHFLFLSGVQRLLLNCTTHCSCALQWDNMAKSFHYLPSEQMRFGLVPDGELVHAKIDGHIMLNTELPSKHRLQSRGGTSSRECQNLLCHPGDAKSKHSPTHSTEPENCSHSNKWELNLRVNHICFIWWAKRAAALSGPRRHTGGD